MRHVPRVHRRWPILVAIALGALAPLTSTRSGAAKGPAASASATADDAASAALKELDDWVRKQGGTLGAAVLDLDSGRIIAARGGTRPLNPASNAKLLTAAAALAELGPDHRFTTGVYGNLRGSVLERPVLRSDGDPSLTVQDLWRLAGTLKELGVRKVEGPLRVDQSRFEENFVPPAFGQQPDEWASFRAPISAVALERNAVTMNVVATKSGEGARVWFDPPGYVKVSGRVDTTDTGSGQAVTLKLSDEGGRLRAAIGGRVAEGLPRLRFQRRVDDPRTYPGWVLKHALESFGIEVEGDVEAGGAGETRRVVWVPSEPLAVLIRELGKHSDNFYAEMILRALGTPEQPDQPATSAAGAARVKAWLERVDAAPNGTKIVNGSGLFDANRVTADGVVRALAAVWHDPALRAEYVAHLAIGGVDGTLRSRLRRHRQSRAVRAKTGTLAAVDALGGFVLAGKQGRPLAFSIMVNGLSGRHGAVRARIDRAVGALVRASRGE